MSDAGKGDTPRPYDRERYERNYQRIFGQDVQENEAEAFIGHPDPEGERAAYLHLVR